MNTFCLDKFRKSYPEYNSISDNWFVWFIGFFEGDGCLTIGKKNIEIVITQNELNKHVLFEIKDKFMFGQVIVQKKFNVPGKLWTYRYIVRDFNGQHVLLTLFHNNLIMPSKKVKYNHFIKIYNEKLSRAKERRKLKFCELKFLNDINKEPFPSSKDSWLCGFVDAEGCFYSGFTQNNQVRVCFDLTQKEIAKYSCENVFNIIKKDIFKDSHISLKKSKNTTSLFLSIRTSSLKKGLFQVHNYFDKFILKTSKIHDFLLQKQVLSKFNQVKDSSDKEQLLNLIKQNRKKLF